MPYEFHVTKKARKWAEKQMRLWIPQCDEEFILDLAFEVGVFDQIKYSPDADENGSPNGFIFDFSDVQLVAFATALTAVAQVHIGQD